MPRKSEAHIASTWKRYFALTVDSTLISFGLALLLWNSIVSGLWVPSPLLEEMELPWGILLQMVIGSSAYWALSQKLWGGSPGKMLFGLRIVDAKSKKPISWRQSILRTISSWLNLLFGIAPVLVALLRLDRRQLSDLIAGTVVVQGQPRNSPPQVRRILASVLIVLFGISGLISARDLSKKFQMRSSGLLVKMQPSKRADPIDLAARKSELDRQLAVQKFEKEGREFARGKLHSQCLTEVFGRMPACEDQPNPHCHTELQGFLGECLSSGGAEPSTCNNVPQPDSAETRNWIRHKCAEKNIHNNVGCGRVLAAVQDFCHKK
jgi:uncharacterized RDD family membrane protein YckC